MVGRSPDARTAVRDFDALRPDVVVLDIRLGDSDGFDVLRHVRLGSTNARVFVFSNEASLPTRQRFLDGGADRVFDKSLEFVALREAVQQMAMP